MSKQRDIWRIAVKERDNHTCQNCGNVAPKKIIAHHIVPIELGGKDDINNGISFCILCHLHIHWVLLDMHPDIIVKSRIVKVPKKLL